MDLTDEEINGIMLSADVPRGTFDAGEILAALEDAVEGALEDALAEQLAASLQGPVSSEALAIARDAADRQASAITGNLARAELNSIAQKVAENIEAGKSGIDLGRQLTEISELDVNRVRQLKNYEALLKDQGNTPRQIKAKSASMKRKLVRERRRTIAVTEQRFATSGANRIIAEDRGQQFKRWITVGDSKVSDMDERNQAEGWVGIDKTFSSGDQFPPSHPNCRCTVAYRSSEPNAFNEASVDAAVEQTAEAKAGV